MPILGSDGLPKGRLNDANTIDGFMTLVGTRDPDLHAKLREPWDRSFASAALTAYDDSIFKRTNQLFERLGKQRGTLDLGEWIAYFRCADHSCVRLVPTFIQL